MSEGNYTAGNHTFAVLSYGESPFLEECIRSLLGQSVRSRIVLATSTPNEENRRLARKYDLELHVNRGRGGIAGDWNHGLRCAGTELVTLAHQDDLYERTYTEKLLLRLNAARQPLIYFTDYYEIREGKRVDDNPLLGTKRKLLGLVRRFPSSKMARRTALCMGNAICCPSITYLKSVVGEDPFEYHFSSNLDWELTEKLSRRKGSFVYQPEPLMGHRIHEESTTSAVIHQTGRGGEDLEMLKKFWPGWIAGIIERSYASAEKSNSL